MKDIRQHHQYIRTLLPMACDGVGPSETCLNIIKGAYSAGYPVEIFANRKKVKDPDFRLRTTLPNFLSSIPYKAIANITSRITEEIFLREIGKNDVAYVWPAASVRAHRILYESGTPIVLEGINTRMASAKRVLDEAYAELGISPAHNITGKRIEEEEEKLSYATAIFAPNSSVEAALSDISDKVRIIPSSYGVDIKKASPKRDYRDKENLKFMFCGYGCVRKGIHFILEAWKKMPRSCVLQIVGEIEPAIKLIYSDVLARENVQEIGFVKDVHSYFSKADVFVFPSLEEGGPQVTYEAALHGLPIIATPAGASRLGDTQETMCIVKSITAEKLLSALENVANSSALRKNIGENARNRVRFFDWQLVGKRRAEILMKI